MAIKPLFETMSPKRKIITPVNAQKQDVTTNILNATTSQDPSCGKNPYIICAIIGINILVERPNGSYVTALKPCSTIFKYSTLSLRASNDVVSNRFRTEYPKPRDMKKNTINNIKYSFFKVILLFIKTNKT